MSSHFFTSRIGFGRVVSLLLALMVFWPVSAAAETSFSLTLEDRAGIARCSEPAKVSLPFAAGKLKEPANVVITDASGKQIPAQFDVLARWDDGSIRWLLAHFVADVPANGKTMLTVKTDGSGAPLEGEDIVSKDGENLLVDAGAIRARLGSELRDGFAVTDESGKALLSEHAQLVVYSPTGKQFRCAAADKVEVEENGPLYASIFMSGPMKAKEPGYDKVLRWETRLHFWKGLARVLAEHTLVAEGAAKDGITVIDGIVLEMKTPSPLSEYVFAGQDDAHRGELRPGKKVRLEQTCAYWHECGSGKDPIAEPVRYVVLEADFGYELQDGKSRSLAKGEKSAGWLWAAGSDRSMGVAVRDFWEEGPKALSAAADGSLGVECYAHWQAKPGEPRPERKCTPHYSSDPRLDTWFAGDSIDEIVKRFLDDTKYPGPVRRGPFRFGQGRAKTTDVLYLFGSADNRQKELDALKARRDYLVPVVDPRYLASTRAMPFIFVAACDSGLPVYEKGLREMFENWKKHATRYGFLHFGDDQCIFGYNKVVPATTDDQEYDTTACLAMQYARTGDAEYFRWADICARHFMDVDQIHYTGHLHYHGYIPNPDYHEESYQCDMNGHPYIAGTIAHYMLTGDRRSLRGVKMLAAALKDYGRGADSYIFTINDRGLSRPGICLAAIYDLTKDPAHLAPVKRVIDAINKNAGDITNELKGQPPFRMWWLNHCEMCGHVRELLVRYHAATGDPQTLQTLKKGLDLYMHDLWDSGENGWYFPRADFNMQYESAVPHEARPLTDIYWMLYQNSMPFAYAAAVSEDAHYLAPFLDGLDDFGGDLAKQFGNRRFTRQQVWSIPFVSMLPADWRSRRDEIVQREVFRAGLKEAEGLKAWTPDGQVEGRPHGELLWQDSPFGKVLRTYGNSFVTFPAPKDILRMPGTVSFWVRRDEARWDRKPHPWYGELRGLLYIGSDARETNALDLMMLKSNLWTRLYDDRAWEMTAITSPNPAWDKGEWHHVAAVWNRFNLSVYIDGKEVGSDNRFTLPAGGQTTINVGWRPTNRYGQADYHDLRIFRTPLSPQRIEKIHDSTKPQVSKDK